MPLSRQIKLLLWRTVHQADQADIPLLRLIPSTVKQAIVRRLLGRTPSAQFAEEVVSYEGSRFRLGLSYSEQQHILSANSVSTHYLRGHLQQGMAFLDIGANIGLYTVLGSKLVGPSGRVYAFEPAHDNLKLLRENIERNHSSNVTIHSCAVGASSGEMTLYIRGEYAGGNSLFDQYLDHPISGTAYPVLANYPVKVERLDDLIQGPVDVVKIDVEGAELDVLAGMTRILAENPKLRMVLEWNPVLQEKTGHGPTQLPETLLAHGFTLDIISPFTAPLRSASDIQAIVPKVVAQFNHTSDIAAVRG